MAPFVVFSLALATMALGVVVVAALQVRTAGAALFDAVQEAVVELRPLGEELTGELAVTTAELESLRERGRERGKDTERIGPGRVH